MPKYRLLMKGTNFLIEINGVTRKHGFYQTLFLESESTEIAEEQAVDIIRNSDLRDLVNNESDDPPIVYLDEVEEVHTFDGIGALIQGRAYYLDDK